MDYTSLNFLTTTAAGKLIGCHRDTVWKWMKRGVNGPGGEIIRLQSRRIGGRWKTTAEWLEAFFTACEGDGRPTAAETPAAFERRARREQKKAMEMLK